MCRAVQSSLALAEEKGLKSIAFPAISTGIYGFPIDRAAPLMLREAMDYLAGPDWLERVLFCLYDDAELSGLRIGFRRHLRRVADDEIEQGRAKAAQPDGERAETVSTTWRLCRAQPRRMARATLAGCCPLNGLMAPGRRNGTCDRKMACRCRPAGRR